MIRTVSSFILRGIAIIALLVGFFLLWCGLRVQSALDAGALRHEPALCMDARHLFEVRAGRVSQVRIVDQVVAREIWHHYYGSGSRRQRQLFGSWYLFIANVGLKLFWSPDERRALYRQVEPNMSPCSGAEEHLRRILARGGWN